MLVHTNPHFWATFAAKENVPDVRYGFAVILITKEYYMMSYKLSSYCRILMKALKDYDYYPLGLLFYFLFIRKQIELLSEWRGYG